MYKTGARVVATTTSSTNVVLSNATVLGRLLPAASRLISFVAIAATVTVTFD